MQISLKWVNELVNIEKVNLDSLIDKLTLGGFEVEEIIEIEIDKKKEVSLDISATANRSDSLSLQGISLEIAALLNETPKVSNYSTESFIWSDKIENLSKNYLTKDDCLGFIAVNIENLTTWTSPNWLKNKLVYSGIKPEDNFKDFQNYILLETGYPFEFYDLEKIQTQINNYDFELKFVMENNNKRFLAVNGVEYELNNSISVVQADQLPISIAGIIANKTVECEVTTKSILVEASIFNAAKIRQQSRTLGLRTDRSARYEKSLKNVNLLESLYQLISLLRISNPNLICKFHTVAQPKIQSNRILTLTFDNVKKVLGPTRESTKNTHQYISKDFITNSLKRLNFDIEYNNIKESWKIIVPNLRSDDIVREIDLIEEIGRLYGFDNFLTRLPSIKNIGKKDLSYQTRKKLTNCFTNLGLNELIQYSLVNEDEYNTNEIELVNPLVKEYANLRASLLPSLLKSVQKNSNQGNSTLEGFEYGHIFLNNERNGIQEIENVAGVFGGVQSKTVWSESSKPLDWFAAKGKIEYILKKLNLSVQWTNKVLSKEKDILHPYCSALLSLDTGEILGVFGQIHPITAKKLNISSDLYLFEFNFEVIQTQMKNSKLAIYHEYSTYPKIIKDLSFIIDKNVSFKQLKKILYLNGSQFLTAINLIDEYSGKNIPINCTSLCVQFVFQSNQTTLQNKRIESILDHLKRVLELKFNAQIRA